MKLIDRVKKPANEQTELSLYLTVRTANILHSKGIDTIEQLAQADEIDLLKTPNFGKRCLGECLDLVQRFVDEGRL
jgi:DNA-directed RNA polymerase alpha subunit